jgi:hypothetical protein
MRNPILDRLNTTPTQQAPSNAPGNPMQMMQQFAQFKNLMRGRDPQQMINQLLQSGKMTPQQFEQLKQQASMLQSILK